MKQTTLLLFFSLFFVVLAGCQEKKSSSKSTASSAYCTGTNYYTVPGCPGYGGGTTSGSNNCIGTNYYTVPGCPGYTGGGTGSSTGGTTGGTTGASSCVQNPFSYACYCQTVPFAYGCSQYYTQGYVSKNWGVKYPMAVTPSRACSPTKNPTGVTGTLYETRKGTITIAGWCNPSTQGAATCAANNAATDGTYNPASSFANGYLNTASVLKSEAGAKSFLLTDSALKIRFKANPEPDAANSSTWCAGRRTGTSMLPGAAKYTFNVTLVGILNGNKVHEPLGSFDMDVNGCSVSKDLSGYAGMYPEGMYLVITDVKSNKGGWPTQQQLDTQGFIGWNTFDKVRSGECWSFDLEVAADGTKTFD